MPAQQQQFIETAFLTGVTGTVAAGTVLCLTADGTRYTIASLTNRTAASRPAACIALTAGDANNIAVEAQFVGVVPPNITGLGTGTATYVRTSDAGVLERTDDLDANVVGHCDADGTAYVCFPLAGMSLGGIISNITGRKVVFGDGTLQGAAHATISSDGYTEHGADRTGGAATVGDDRYAKNSTAYVRSQDGTKNKCVWSHSLLTFSGCPATDILDIGRNRATNADDQDIINVVCRYGGGFAFGPDSGRVVYFGAYADILTSAPGMSFVYAAPNFAILRTANTSLGALAADPFLGGKVMGLVQAQLTDASGNPTSGFFYRANPSTNRFELKFPAGDALGDGWHDPFVDVVVDEGPVLIITATGDLGTIDLTVDGEVARTVHFTGAASVIVDGFHPAPTAGRSQHLTLNVNLSGEDTTLTLHTDSADDATERIALLSGSTIVFNRGMHDLAYDQTASDGGAWRAYGDAT